MELVVTDDGSTDETAEIVEQFRRRVPFPVAFTTHEHVSTIPPEAATTAPGRRPPPICCSSTAIAFCRPTTSPFIWLSESRAAHARRLLARR